MNVGRVVATAGAMQIGALMQAFHRSYARAGTVITRIRVPGLLVIWLGPETESTLLPE
jgi:MFS transporter, SHS family, sialic acid transporter